MKKNYHYVVNVIWSEEDKAYVAQAPELPGCSSHGATYETAIKNIQEAIESWIEGAKESGFKIPEPIATKKYSGKFIARVDPKTHRALSIKAETAGKSLNSLVNEILQREIA